MKSTDLEALRIRASKHATGTVTTEGAALLELLSHIDELRSVPRLYDDELEVIQAPVIERMDLAERRVATARPFAQLATRQ